MNRTVCSRRDRILPRAAGRKALACLLALVLTAGLGGLLSVSADTATDGYYETKTTRVFTPFALKKTASYEATDEFTASTADSLWQFGYTTGGGYSDRG